MKSQLFHPDDPLAQHRELDDDRYAPDHFRTKLLKLPALMNTPTGQRLAPEKADYLQQFLEKITLEISGVGVV